jgi:hypothetical protein
VAGSTPGARAVTGSAEQGSGALERIGRAVVGAAEDFAFPVALALMVAAFLIVQDRLDRKDPKLALAPHRPEVVRFE